MKVAKDESYRELTNLQSKLQKHQAFEAELLSNRAGIESVCKVSLINDYFLCYNFLEDEIL